MKPGTNAVFKVSDAVLKIFAPPASGIDTARDFAVESALLRHAEAAGIPAPRLLHKGVIDDRYRFRYLILSFIPGQDACDVLPGWSSEQRSLFAQEIVRLCGLLHQPAPGLLPKSSLLEQALKNDRLASLSPSMRASMRARARRISTAADVPVLVHGDITGENVRVDDAGHPALIDFADALLAPWWYELAPLVFELFRCDSTMVRVLAGKGPLSGFIGRLLDSLSLHAFGANIVLDFAERNGIAPDDIPTLDALGNRLFLMWR